MLPTIYEELIQFIGNEVLQCSLNGKRPSARRDPVADRSHTDLWTTLYGTWIHAEITVKSFQDFFYYQTKHPGITVHTVFSEKHQSEHVEFRAVDKVCNLFGAEFCDMKRELLWRGVVDRGILLKKKQLFLSSKDF